MPRPHPLLLQINTRVYTHELGVRLNRPATLDDIPDADLDDLARLGYDWAWLLGIWQTGPRGREISLAHEDWHKDYRTLLPDFSDADVCGSPFAVRDYVVHEDFGGNDALHRLRHRLDQRNLRLLLDFVPNHTAQDHSFVQRHPEFYIQGTEGDLQRDPLNFRSVKTDHGPRILALGRDPYFPGWPDTFQLNYRHAPLREAMISLLQRIAEMCDGVRCDMAMLLLPEVIQRTWGDLSLPADGSAPLDQPFWPDAIPRIQAGRPNFVFMAEVYWDLEGTLQEQGFTWTYDKRLYDRLSARNVPAVNGHLHADDDFQSRSVRFLENHDEPRAAATFPHAVHRPAALLTYLVPGVRFFYEGQLEGRRQRTSNHLCRRPPEPVDNSLHDFYARLLELLRDPAMHEGIWSLCACRPAWDDNSTWQNFVAFTWKHTNRFLVVVNYGDTQAQCFVTLPFARAGSGVLTFTDRLSDARYERDGADLAERGLYLDLPPWGFHVFEVA